MKIDQIRPKLHKKGLCYLSSVKSFGKMSNYEKLRGGCKACVEKGCFDPPEDFDSARLVVAKEVLGSRHGRFTVGIKDHSPFYFFVCWLVVKDFWPMSCLYSYRSWRGRPLLFLLQHIVDIHVRLSWTNLLCNRMSRVIGVGRWRFLGLIFYVIASFRWLA